MYRYVCKGMYVCKVMYVCMPIHACTKQRNAVQIHPSFLGQLAAHSKPHTINQPMDKKKQDTNRPPQAVEFRDHTAAKTFELAIQAIAYHECQAHR